MTVDFLTKLDGKTDKVMIKPTMKIIKLKLALNLQLFFSATDDNEDDFDESGEVFDDAASSASTLPIAQACPNTLSVALRQEQINYKTKYQKYLMLIANTVFPHSS